MNKKYAINGGLGATTDLSEIKSEGMHEEQSSLPCYNNQASESTIKQSKLIMAVEQSQEQVEKSSSI